MKYDELAALTPVVRKEVLSGEFSRRIQALEMVSPSELNDIVESLTNLALSDVIQTLDSTDKLKEQVNLRRKNVQPTPPPKSASPIYASQISSTSDLNAANATASAPEHPSTPISVNATLSTPPRTSSPSGSVQPTSERERMLAAINKFENSRQEELTDLLMSLPKRERAMCLFNHEILRAKLVDAKAVLDVEDDEEEPQTPATTLAPKTPEVKAPVPVTPKATKTAPKVDDTPVTPALSSRGASAAASPAPATPGTAGSGSQYTIASLAKLPAAEIVRLANSSAATGLPLPKADPLVVQATDEFIDGLLDQTVLVQKQKLGDKLYKVVKSFGVKGAVRSIFFNSAREVVDVFLL